MAVHLNIKSLQKNNDRSGVRLHWMPCEIYCNGEAKVSKYFEPVIIKQRNGVLQASFRGYPLLGREIHVPKNYTGVILQETNEKLNEEAERDLYGVQLFDKFTYWNWDAEPSDNDTISMALEWLEVAKILHSSVES